MRLEEPTTYEEAAEALARAAANGERVRFRGGGTKFDWGNAVREPDVITSTARLNRILEHNAADLTAVVQAGVSSRALQERLAASGQMLGLDPPLGPADEATIGGIVATSDSGPLRHRYGAPRDLLLGMTVALSDGSIARSGGKVIKNVAGYDLAKLFAGSFGTLGMILEVAVRLHPLPRRMVSMRARTDDPDVLQRATVDLMAEPLELSSLDVWWDGDAGGLLARLGGVAPDAVLDAADRRLRGGGLDLDVIDGADHEKLWGSQRSAQRSAEGVVAKVSGLATGIAETARAVARLGGRMVGRASGSLWCAFPIDEVADAVGMVEDFRNGLAPSACVVLDAPDEVRAKVDVWGVTDGQEVQLMRRLKQRFDPANVCNTGIFVGGI
jgi:glycolate oxidase FAD binding subunit